MNRLGNTDTIIQRTQNQPKGGGTVPVTVRAMFLKSTHSVTFIGQAVDVYVTLNNSVGAISTSALPQPDALEASGGTMTIRTNGTFDSNITINADVIFVKAGANVTNPANYVGHVAAPADSLSSLNSSWSPKAPSGYPSDPSYPSGGFYLLAVRASSHPFVPASCPAPNSAHPAPSSAAGATTTCKPVK